MKKDLQYHQKRCKLDVKAYIDFFIGYKSKNIYKILVLYKKKVISVRNVIFNEDEIWDSILFQCIANKIKELNKAIQIIELSQIDKLEDIQLSKDLKFKSEIIYQTDHKAEDLDTDNVAGKINIDKLVKDKD